MEKPQSFHVRLRYERELRGWSQADVASKVGSDPKTVARWESGKSVPRPYHRQALGELFGLNAEEFGLVSGQRAIIPLPLPETGPSSLPPAAVSDTADVPREEKARTYQNIEGIPPPTNPRAIQQRDSTVRAVYARLLHPDTTALVLTGIGGVGKSTLAALVYRYAWELYQAGEGFFPAPPLWLTVGEGVTMTDLVGTLLEALGAPLPDLERLPPQPGNDALSRVEFGKERQADRPGSI